MEGGPNAVCPACGGGEARRVYRAEGVPVQSVRLLRDQDEARRFPTGDLDLTFCTDCGFLWNAAFDPERLDYGVDYEATQGFSGTFGAFHSKLAQDLVARHGLEGGTVVEIGCGQGEFLQALCDAGAGRGIGIDPAYRPGAADSPHDARVTVHRQVLGEGHGGIDGDLICCKMTLEHVDAPAEFLALVGRTLANVDGSRLFFQVPEARRILEQGAFWDVYYEHCSYFSPGSLARLFRRSGLRVLNLWTDYDDQYLMIEAERAAAEDRRLPLAPEESLVELSRAVDRFAGEVATLLEGWRAYLEGERAARRPVALWGGSSKAVAFLSAVSGPDAAISAVVDINPRKHGSYLPGSGLPVIAPGALPELAAGSIVVMNPVYHDEIARDLAALGVAPRLLTVDRAPEPARAA